MYVKWPRLTETVEKGITKQNRQLRKSTNPQFPVVYVADLQTGPKSELLIPKVVHLEVARPAKILGDNGQAEILSRAGPVMPNIISICIFKKFLKKI